MEELIKSFAIGGYRSFGQSIQHLEKLTKVNILIGQNNSGKSNIIRFLYTIFSKSDSIAKTITDPLNIHKPSGATPIIGWCEPLIRNATANVEVRLDLPILQKINEEYNKNRAATVISELFLQKSKLDGRDGAWFYIKMPNKDILNENWDQAFNVISDSKLQMLTNDITNGRCSGGREFCQHEVFRALHPTLPEINVVLIPAIRKVGDKGSSSEEFSGDGLIERLARLQNPDVHNQEDRIRFNHINKFLPLLSGIIRE